jgi:hypothetical protein
VLVGYLDVRFPNWDQDERSAKYDYFFPAISEKFPQLLTKAAKGRFKYAEGPRVSPELARRPVVRAKPAGSFFGAVIRGIIFGGLVLGLVIAAVKYGRGELQLPFELPFDKNAAKPSTTAAPDKNLSAPSGIASPDIKPPPAVASTAAPAPASTLGTPAPRFAAATPAATPPAQPSAPPVVATTPPSPPAMVTDAPANPPPANPAALPSSVSLFDTPAPPAAATPAPATTTAGPAATPAPQVVMGRINKPTLVSLKFGTSTLRAGTPVQIMAVDVTSVKIKFGPDIVTVPASNVDLPESATSTQPPSAVPPTPGQ